MTRLTTAMLVGTLLVALAAIAISLLLPVGQLQAQPRATLQARSLEIQQTVGVAQTQVEYVRQTAQVAQQDIQAGATRLVATAEAVRATVQAVQTNSVDLATRVAGTAQVLATTINQRVADVQATATVISALVQARLAALPPEIAELIAYLVEQTSLEYDPVAGTLTVTSYVSEEQANILIDVLVEAGGYKGDAVSIDTRADGTAQVNLVDVSRDFSGRVVLTYQLILVEGRARAVLIGVTINGADVPLEMVPEDLGSASSLAIAGAAQQVFVNLGQTPVNYTVESVLVAEDGFLVTYTVYLQ